MPTYYHHVLGSRLVPSIFCLKLTVVTTFIYYIETIVVMFAFNGDESQFPFWASYPLNVLTVFLPAFWAPIKYRREISKNLGYPWMYYYAHFCFFVVVLIGKLRAYVPSANIGIMGFSVLGIGGGLSTFIFRRKLQGICGRWGRSPMYDVEKKTSLFRVDNSYVSAGFLFIAWGVVVMLTAGLQLVTLLESGLGRSFGWFLFVNITKVCAVICTKRTFQSPAKAAVMIFPFQGCEDLVSNILLCAGVKPFTVDWFITLVWILSYELYRDTLFKSHVRLLGGWVKRKRAAVLRRFRVFIGKEDVGGDGDAIDPDLATEEKQLDPRTEVLELFLNIQNIIWEGLAGMIGVLIVLCELISSSLGIYDWSPFDIPKDGRGEITAGMAVLCFAELSVGRLAYRMNLVSFRNRAREFEADALQQQEPDSVLASSPQEINVIPSSNGNVTQSGHQNKLESQPTAARSSKISRNSTKHQQSTRRTMTTKTLSHSDKLKLSETNIQWTPGLLAKFMFYSNPDDETLEAIVFAEEFFLVLQDHLRKARFFMSVTMGVLLLDVFYRYNELMNFRIEKSE